MSMPFAHNGVAAEMLPRGSNAPMPELMFAPLSRTESRWKSFVSGWGIQAAVVALLLVSNATLRQPAPQARKLVYTSLLAPVEARVHQLKPVNSRLVVKLRPELAMKAPLLARLVVPRQLHEIKQTEPEIKAPEINVAAAAPVLPNLPATPLAKVVATNTFATPPAARMAATVKPTGQVQTGGFGDPNGMPATSEGNRAPNIPARGSGGVVQGAGFGTGFNRDKGTEGVSIADKGVLQSSGFDRPYSAAAPKQITPTPSAESGTPVEIMEKPQPLYTEEGRKRGVEGEVRLEVRFTADKQVHVLRILQGLGFGLDEQAIRAAEHIKFKPAMHEGRAIDSTAIVHIIFELAS